MLTKILLLLAVSTTPFLPSASASKTVTLEDFGTGRPDGTASPSDHTWYAISDRVMGGQSVGLATSKGGAGEMTGEVRTVPSTGKPGFLAMQSRDGFWPDLRSCRGLTIISRSKSSVPYPSFKLTFGTALVPSASEDEDDEGKGRGGYQTGYKARGYKASFKPSTDGYNEQTIYFNEFSNYWDVETGEIIKRCENNPEYCPDDETLKNLRRLEIVAEGALGVVDLKIAAIRAVGCDHDVVSVDPNPELNLQGGRGQGTKFGEEGDDEIGNGKGKAEEFKGHIKPEILPNGDVRIESVPNLKHTWFAMNDPIMGGQSTSTVTVDEEKDVIVFEGTVENVPSLNKPGFIKMETRGGEFPDVSHCNALKLQVKAPMNYSGMYVTFGVHHAEGTMPYVRGYKNKLDLNKNEGDANNEGFQTIVMPFTDFSDNWDPQTGETVISCAWGSEHCPDEATLRYMTTLSIMREGALGDIRLEVKSIDATDCSYEKGTGAGKVLVGLILGIACFAGVAFYIRKRERGCSSMCLSVFGSYSFLGGNKKDTEFGANPVEKHQEHLRQKSPRSVTGIV